MAKIKLVLSDMDGTLVPAGERKVSRRTLKAIHALRDAGIAFGPSSGRERGDLLDSFWDDEACVASGIMGNGKLVYLNNKLVMKRPLPFDVMQRVARAVKPLRGVALSYYEPLSEDGMGKAGLFGTAATEEDVQLILSEFGAELFRGITPELPPNLTTCNVVMATSLADPQQVRATLEQVAPELDFPVPINFVLDIVEKGWSKLSALPILEEALGVTRNEIAYFGDSENDLTMMRAIPHSFCMGNGTKEAKEAARSVIDTDVNDGAAQIMERLAANGGEL